MSEQPEDPSADQGGMTLESGAEAVGGMGGPNFSPMPTYEDGVLDGRQQQYTIDHEALGHEDPIGDLLKAGAGGAHGAVHLGTDVAGDIPDLLGNSSGDGGDGGAGGYGGPDATVDSGDAGAWEGPDATVEQPDATIQSQPDATVTSDAGTPGDDDGGYSSDQDYSSDPGYSDQDAGAY
ncbi:MAG TPA: hypothetical protein VGS19_32015 [Streptosporangiaceae bacterium]|nr:hypothetical protein [Streptosporangiaceae bacterium]